MEKNIFAEVKELSNNINDNFLAIGELLSNIKKTKSYRAKGYNKFKDFVCDEYNITPSLTNRLIYVYEKFKLELEISVGDIISIGLDKLYLLKYVMKNATKEDIEYFIDLCLSKTYTEVYDEIQEIKRIHKEQSLTEYDKHFEELMENMMEFYACSKKDLTEMFVLYLMNKDDEDKEEIYNDAMENKRIIINNIENK